MQPADAGKDFDNWLDWSGNANSTLDPNVLSSSVEGSENESHHITYPVSPSSTTHSESRPSLSQPNRFTASNARDLPTPDHSSGSPEGPHYVDNRLSGDTLREFPTIIARPLLKRKLSPQNSCTLFDEDNARPAAKKRPHNVIEKRYRANLNEKIAELRDSVPSLRVIKKTQTRDDACSSDNEDLDGLSPSNKLNKASILTKAVEYIRHLELRNRRLDDENKTLKERLQTLDKMLARGDSSENRAAAFTSQDTIEQELDDSAQIQSKTESKKTSHPPQGLIPLPEIWRKFRANQSQEHYGHIYDTPSESNRQKGKWPARLMVGSLAGLMIMEGFGESDQGTASKEKGLFGIPLELLDGYRFLASPRVYLAAFGQFCQAGGVLPLIKGFMALSILAFCIFAYLFNSKPPLPKEEKSAIPSAPEESSLTSPIEVRRRAWSTSMQTLGLPHHQFFREWLAVTAEWIKYTIRYLFGASAYAWVTGRSGEDEVARIKAWDIAIDAQLAGGDPEVSRSRVVLTSFGSGTLPRSPLRLMLKALHCRVLMWRVGGHQDSKLARIANSVAVYFSNREWRRARQLQCDLDKGHSDHLPTYLAALLDNDCDDVFTNAVVQRAYNLMYDRPTSEDAGEALMDVVVEDHAIRSPLDAIAAWWSTQTLQKVLCSSIETPQDASTRHRLQSALAVAPPHSAAQTRALALHAVFYTANRKEYCMRAASALTQSSTSPLSSLAGPHFIDSSTPASARSEISNLLRCVSSSQTSKDFGITGATIEGDTVPEASSSLVVDVSSMTLLSFAALHFRLRELQDENQASSSPVDTTEVVATLCSWLQSGHADITMISADVRQKIENSCCDNGGLRCKRRMSNLSNDTGYGTQEEEGDMSLDKDRLMFTAPLVGDLHV